MVTKSTEIILERYVSCSGTDEVLPLSTHAPPVTGPANFTLDMTANFTSDIIANFTSDMIANFTSDMTANFTSDMTANSTSDMTANFTSDINEFFSGNYSGGLPTWLEEILQQTVDRRDVLEGIQVSLAGIRRLNIYIVFSKIICCFTYL